jgi:hypothetical protein
MASALLAIHYAWVDGYSTQTPVGIWNESGDAYYPPEHIDKRDHAESIITHPHQLTWAEWLDEKTYASSAYGANWGVVTSESSLQSAYESVLHDFLETAPTAPLFLPGDAENDEVAETARNSDESIPWGYVRPAARFEIERSWWIAAELVRRHPELAVLELHPGGGLGDVLSIRTTSAGAGTSSTDIWINRGGSIRVHTHRSDASTETVDVGTLSQAFERDDPHDVVKAIEHAARLELSRHAPPSTPRALSVRVFAAFLTMSLNDRHRWDVRNEVQDDSYGVSRRGYVQRFAGAEAALRDAATIGLPEEPHTQAWALLRDDEPVALMLASGVLFFGGAAIPVLPQYEASDRRITATTMRLLGELLP